MRDALRIAELPAGGLGGLIGLTLAPGKKQNGGMSGSHDRDLATDLDAVAAWNAAAVVTLIEDNELRRFHIDDIGEAVHARFMEWHHLPIRDGEVPDEAFEAEWPRASARVRALLGAGNRVLVHCCGGLGRAGMISARLLVETGADADAAVVAVRHDRGPGAIETEAQEAWVRRGTRRDDARPDAAGARDRAVGALLGLAVGDAVGTAIEFTPKPDRAVLHDMVGGGPFGLKPGQWTDDTSMALALGDSLLAAPDLDPNDLMRRFVAWYRNGEYSCTGECFDIGGTTSSALHRFERSGNPYAGPTGKDTAGNGSIMRFAPVAIRHWRDAARLHAVARDQSRTTHGAPQAMACCETLADLLAAAIRGSTLRELVSSAAAARVEGFEIAQPRAKIQGSGYVVESLHAALWAVSRTSTFRDAVLLAVNLGRDADTTGAIAGQIAGALYGASQIPADWLGRLAWRERINRMAGELFDAGSCTDQPSSN